MVVDYVGIKDKGKRDAGMVRALESEPRGALVRYSCGAANLPHVTQLSVMET